MKCFNTTRNNGEKQDKGGVEIKNCSAKLIFTSVNKAGAGTHTGRTGNRNNVTEKGNSRQNGSDRSIDTTNTHSSREEEPRKTQKKGRTLLRKCEVTLAWRSRNESEVRQGER